MAMRLLLVLNFTLPPALSDEIISIFSPIASAAAACSLFEANSVDGMRSKEEIYEVMRSFVRRSV